MHRHFERRFIATVVMLLVFTRAVLLQETTTVPVSTEGDYCKNCPGENYIDDYVIQYKHDCASKNYIKEMMLKLETVVTGTGSRLHPEATDTSTPCIDLSSSQSVLTQVCDRLTSLATKVNTLTSKMNPESANNHNSGGYDYNKPFTQIAKLKEEIKQLKRSAVFYASRREHIGNFTHERIVNYSATVNSGDYFDPPNGMFYTPFEGVYHFTFSYQKTPEVNLEACLLVDKEVIAKTSDERQPKIDILTSLKPGQEVWTDLTSNSIPTNSEVNFTFSGYFVH